MQILENWSSTPVPLAGAADSKRERAFRRARLLFYALCVCGFLGHWIVGLLCCWAAGLLGCRAVGLLACGLDQAQNQSKMDPKSFRNDPKGHPKLIILDILGHLGHRGAKNAPKTHRNRARLAPGCFPSACPGKQGTEKSLFFTKWSPQGSLSGAILAPKSIQKSIKKSRPKATPKKRRK